MRARGNWTIYGTSFAIITSWQQPNRNAIFHARCCNCIAVIMHEHFFFLSVPTISFVPNLRITSTPAAKWLIFKLLIFEVNSISIPWCYYVEGILITYWCIVLLIIPTIYEITLYIYIKSMGNSFYTDSASFKYYETRGNYARIIIFSEYSSSWRSINFSTNWEKIKNSIVNVSRA